MIRKPDPAATYAVVIGVSQYEDDEYTPHPTIGNSARRIAALLREPTMWDLPDDHVEELVGAVSAQRAMAAIERFAELSTDALLVYFAGHGNRYTDIPDRGLHFALTESRRRWGFSHLPFTDVQRVLRNAGAGWKGLIVDACYSDNLHLAPAEPVRMDVQGLCALTATKYRDVISASCSIPGYQSYTAFSGALFSVIDQGIPGAPTTLTLRRIFPVLTDVLKRWNQRPPHMSEELSTDMELAFCDNEAPREELAAFSGADLSSVPPRVYARAVEREHAEGRTGAAATMVREFCATRGVGDTLVLALELRTAALDRYADDAISRTYEAGTEEQIRQLVHALHEPGDTGASRLMDVLVKRSGAVCVRVLARLGEQRCDGCDAVVAALDELIPERWPADRLAELFTAMVR